MTVKRTHSSFEITGLFIVIVVIAIIVSGIILSSMPHPGRGVGDGHTPGKGVGNMGHGLQLATLPEEGGEL